jgi:hypothetical protein
MMNKRASIFDDAAELDVGAFKPETALAPKPDYEKLKAISEASNFPSRQAKPLQASAPTRREPRRHRTGRTAQFNVRTTPQTVDEFYHLADRKGWLVGETLEHALAALKREMGEGG